MVRQMTKTGYAELTEEDLTTQAPVFHSLSMEKKSQVNQAAKMAAKSVGTLKLQSLITQLRKVCNHPYLFDIEDEGEELEQAKEHVSQDLLETKTSTLPGIIGWSGKMILLDRLLTSLLARGHSIF